MIKKFYPPEKIICKNINAFRRTHIFDEQNWEIVDRNRDFLRKFLLWVDKTNSLKDSKKTTKMFIKNWNNQTNFAYIITDKEDIPLGSIDLQNIDLKNGNVSFGYFLDEKETGNGYISEILQELEKILLEKGFIRFEIRCSTQNLQSNNVAKRNGYILEGTHRKALKMYEEFHDINVYGKVI